MMWGMTDKLYKFEGMEELLLSHKYVSPNVHLSSVWTIRILRQNIIFLNWNFNIILWKLGKSTTSQWFKIMVHAVIAVIIVHGNGNENLPILLVHMYIYWKYHLLLHRSYNSFHVNYINYSPWSWVRSSNVLKNCCSVRAPHALFLYP